jgi:hypothetical protein
VFVLDRIIEHSPDSVLDAETQPESQSRRMRSGNWRESLGFGSIGSIPPVGTTDACGLYAIVRSASASAGDITQFSLSRKAVCREMAATKRSSLAEPRGFHFVEPNAVRTRED